MRLPLTAVDRRNSLLHACLTLLAVVSMAWTAQYPFWPLHGDAGFWLWVGEVISEGGLPYRDAWDIKGPLPFYVGALTHVLFGRNEWGIRVVDLLWLGAGVLAVRRLPAIRGVRISAVAAPLFLIFWYGSLGPWRTVQPDFWAGLLVLLAVLAATRDRAGRGWPVLAGALCCGAALVKPQYALFLLIPGVAATLRPDGGVRRELAGPLLLMVGFGLVASGVTAALWSAGILDEFVDATVLYPLAAYRDSDAFGGSIGAGLLGNVRDSPFLAATPIALLGLWKLWSTRRRDAVMLATWIALAALNVVIQNKYWLYHWLPALVPVAITAAVGFRYALELLLSKTGASTMLPLRAAAFAALLATAAQTLSAPITQTAISIRMLAGALPAGAIGMKNPRIRASGPNSLAGVAAYLRTHTLPDDPVLALSNLVALNYLSDRPSPSRLGMTRSLFDGGDNPHRRRYRTEFETALALKPPMYIVMLAPGVCAAAEAGSFDWRNCLFDYPWLLSLRDEAFVLETERAGLGLFRRRPGS